MRFNPRWPVLVAGSLALALHWMTAPSAAALSATQREAVLAEAQRHYDDAVADLRGHPDRARQQFGEAAARFQQLADDGIRSGGLEYNLGNAYLQSGDVGRAILHYRRAETITPGDGRLAHNLDYARSLRRDGIQATGRRALLDTFLAWHHGTPAQVRFAVFAGAWIVFWGVLGLRVSRPVTGWKWLAGVTAAVWIAFGSSVVADLLPDPTLGPGVVLAEEVIVRKGNGEGFEPQFVQPLHAGAEFRTVDQRGSWIQIELPNGKRGWIPDSAMAFVRE